MPDDELPEPEEQEEDEYERRFREIEERAKAVRHQTPLPQPPEIKARKLEAPVESSSGKFSKPGVPAHYSNSLGLALAIGYSFVGPILAGILFGYLMDRKSGGPWTMVGLLAGFIIALVLLVRLMNKLNQNEK